MQGKESGFKRIVGFLLFSLFTSCCLPFATAANSARLLPPAAASCLLVSTATAHQPARVIVSPESTALHDRITLGDIAEVQAAETAVAARLRGIALGYAPDVGRVRELSRDRIQLAVQAAGFAAGTVDIVAPVVVRIRRASQQIDPDRVREAVERVVLKDLRAIGATARVARFDTPPVMEAPAGEMEIRVQAGGVRDLFAPFISTVEIWQNGRVVERFSITTEVEAHAHVLVAAQDLPANLRFSPGDAVLEIRRLERMPSLYLREVDRLRGMYPRRSLARGEVITADLLVSDLVIKPGDDVRILTQSDRLQISAAGEARAAGRVGDRISVRNKQSGMVLQATVIDEGLVRVNY